MLIHKLKSFYLKRHSFTNKKILNMFNCKQLLKIITFNSMWFSNIKILDDANPFFNGTYSEDDSIWSLVFSSNASSVKPRNGQMQYILNASETMTFKVRFDKT